MNGDRSVGRAVAWTASPGAGGGLSRRELVSWGFGGGACATLRAVPALADASAPSTPDTLSALLSVELLAVFAYAHVSPHPELTPTVASVTAKFLAHEQLHVQLLTDELAKLGVAPPTGPSTAAAADALLNAHGGSGSFSALHNQRDCLKILQQVESVLEGGYFRAIRNEVSEPLLIHTIAEIMAAEAQHWTALTGLRHPGIIERAVPSAFVEGMY